MATPGFIPPPLPAGPPPGFEQPRQGQQVFYSQTAHNYYGHDHDGWWFWFRFAAALAALLALAAWVSTGIGIWFIEDRDSCSVAITLPNCVNYTDGSTTITFSEFNLIAPQSGDKNVMKPSDIKELHKMHAPFSKLTKPQKSKDGASSDADAPKAVGSLSLADFDVEVQFSRVGNQVTLTVPYMEIDTTGQFCANGVFAMNALPSNVNPDLGSVGCTQQAYAGYLFQEQFYGIICLYSENYFFDIVFDDCYLNTTITMPGFSLTYTGA